MLCLVSFPASADEPCCPGEPDDPVYWGDPMCCYFKYWGNDYMGMEPVSVWCGPGWCTAMSETWEVRRWSCDFVQLISANDPNCQVVYPIGCQEATLTSPACPSFCTEREAPPFSGTLIKYCPPLGNP